jgi:hypothetical protein
MNDRVCDEVAIFQADFVINHDAKLSTHARVSLLEPMSASANERSCLDA